MLWPLFSSCRYLVRDFLRYIIERKPISRPNDMVRLILTVHCLNHVFHKSWWPLHARNITKHFIVWHHTSALSAEWGMVAFVDYSCCLVLISWETTATYDWIAFCVCIAQGRFTAPNPCLLNYMKKGHLGSFYSGFEGKRPFKINLMHRNTENIPRVPILMWLGMTLSLTSQINSVKICPLFLLICHPENFCGYFLIPILPKQTPSHLVHWMVSMGGLCIVYFRYIKCVVGCIICCPLLAISQRSTLESIPLWNCLCPY